MGVICRRGTRVEARGGTREGGTHLKAGHQGSTRGVDVRFLYCVLRKVATRATRAPPMSAAPRMEATRMEEM